MTNPSGDQFWLEVDGQEACVVEVGGGLRTYTVDGVDVVDGYSVDEMATGGRGQLLLPWPNRIEDGKYPFAGQELQLPLTEPAHHNAIHGLTRWASWTATVNDGDRVVMEHVVHPQPGYPFTLGLAVEYRLGPGGLSVETTATNLGDRPCPYGAGAHPYLTVGTELVDDVELFLPASEYMLADERGIPRERRLTVRSPYRFYETMQIGDKELDTPFGGLTGNEAVIASPDGQRRVRLWWDDSHKWVMLYTGDSLDPSRRRRSLAIEPMTCPPNAFATGLDLKVLEPEKSWTTAWGIEANPAR